MPPNRTATPPLLPLPIAPADFNAKILAPALALLPPQMDSRRARVLLTAIALQESGLAHRWQVVDARRPERKGPARGLLQFELGTRASRGGVTGVCLHPATRPHLQELCEDRRWPFAPRIIWAALETDDVLAAVLGRLLLYTDPPPLPAADDVQGAFDLYLRTWRPGAWARGSAAQRRELRAKWVRNHAAARRSVA